MDTASPEQSPAPSIAARDFLQRLGRPGAPLVIDARRDEAFARSERLLPLALRLRPGALPAPPRGGAREVLVYCVHGHEVSATAAAQLRAAGWDARLLEGGIEGLVEAGLPTLRKRSDLGVDGRGGSRWITRERPKIDRIACPWLIRRFIDPQAEFIYVPAAQVPDRAQALNAVAYDTPGAPIAHQGAHCSFDALLQAFDLHDPALERLALIVRGADTDRLDLTPQSAGLLAFSRGLAHLHDDDHAMLEAALPLYDALYAWCRT